MDTAEIGGGSEFNPRSILPTTFKYVDLESVVGTSLIFHRTENADTAPSRAQRLAQKGDVFYQTVRPYQMNNYLFDLPFDNFVFSTGYAQLRPSGDSYFLLSRLQEKKFVADVLDKSTGTSYPAINSSDLAKIEIGIAPNIHEQSKVGSFFRTLDELLAATQRKVAGLKQLKTAYLQQMFVQAGEKAPRLRFEGFNDDWEDRKLDEVSTVEMCRRIFKEETSSTGEVPFYKIGTFGGKPDAYISQSIFDEYKAKYPYPEIGDILISASGTIGRTVIYQGEQAYFQDSNIVWLNTNKEQLVNIFLHQFYHIAKWSGIEGTTIKRLYNSNILDTNIALPAIQKQTAIGNFFRNFDMQINTQSEKLEKLKQLKSAYLQKMFI